MQFNCSACIMEFRASALVVVQVSHIEVRICVLLAIGSMLNDCCSSDGIACRIFCVPVCYPKI